MSLASSGGRAAGRAVVASALAALAACDSSRPLHGEAQAVCTTCHGGVASSDGAPPRDAAGRADGPAVGAHQAHLAHGVACRDCHLVPADESVAAHDRARSPAGSGSGSSLLTFGARAAAGGVLPAFDPVTRSCTVACHGAALGAAGPAAPPRWDQPGPLGCDGCHGGPPATGAHRRHATRAAGLLAYGDTRPLEAVDPASTQADYGFGCGACHPLDAARHGDGTVQVELAPDGAPPGSLRARNAPEAAYDSASGRCAGVACHSSGQATPAYLASPPWTGGPDPAGCEGCHGNPPLSLDGAPGTPASNGHLVLVRPDLGAYSSSTGHARDTHSMPHGGEYDGFGWRPPHGSPITCQACHYDTVDPSNTAPGGFYYLDTTVRTQVLIMVNKPGGLLRECQGCHTGAPDAPPAGAGRVLPLRHVNGRRDVVFDRRTAVPPGFYAGVVAPLPAPVAPYFFTNAFYDFYSDMLPYMTPATILSAKDGTISFPLTEAAYDPDTRTCSSVACHYQQSAPGQPPLVWGAQMEIPPPTGGCNSCH